MRHIVARCLPVMLLPLLLCSCAAPIPHEALRGHLHGDMAQADTAEAAASASIPKPVQHALALPVSGLAAKTETYSVVVHDVPVQDLLFALARDAKINVDIHAGLSGHVTLNAIEQTLPQLLSRIARQVDMRFELDGPNLAVMPDTPFLRHYNVDYVNMSRSVSGEVATNTQINSGYAGGEVNTGSTLGNGNVSTTRVENLSRNLFWESLEQNIKDILRETDKTLPPPVDDIEETGVDDGVPESANRAQAKQRPRAQRRSAAPTIREAAAVIVNVETGIITVRATGRQHERIGEFIDRVANAARRQVMIEATIVEVELDEGYRQGIEWSRVWAEGNKAFAVTPTSSTAGVNPTVTPFVLNIANQKNPLSVTLNLLQSFGTTRVLSSPRLSVLNNQTALLKVVENVVYFNIKADVTAGNTNSNAIVAYTTTPQTVSVGLVMTVTPQISDSDQVILNVRPTISSIAGMVKDPNPDIPGHIANEIPQIRTREIESILRLASGEIAVLGGLMEDRVDYKTGRTPILGQIPFAGEVFTARNDAAKKSELVIFLRPIVVRDPGLQGDFAALRGFLPDVNFFDAPEK
ncbi:MAG: type II and III secretion system protein [Zoogloeaceae bacterium]|nr:type II and III secretion system protein [Zoogloeaceae bacterium]